jgi:MFS family permease
VPDSKRADREPAWPVALVTMVAVQMATSFLTRIPPTLAPALAAERGWSDAVVGYLASLNTLGAILFLALGAPFLRRMGSVRALQAGLALGIVGLTLLLPPFSTAAAMAALLIGMGYGPSSPAGNDVLHRTAPARWRAMIFSIKQAGAPLGGAMAGLVLAPAAAAWGWPAALAIAIAVGLCAAAIITPTTRRLNFEREPDRPIGPAALFNPRNVAAPFRLLKASTALLGVTGLAFSFAAVQGSLFSFSVTYLTLDRHMPLAAAGFAYAAMQFSGVFARVFLGWLADRTGRPALNLAVQAFFAAALLVGYGFLPENAPLATAALICGATGFFAASWNGIYMAEVARLSPPKLITEMTSSSTVMVFLGYVSGPSIFSLLVTWSGNYRLPFIVLAAQLALMAAVQMALLARRLP